MATTDNSFFMRGGSRGVLLIHGLTGTPTEMKFVGKGLAAAGFSAMGMQLAGHCGTEKDLIETTWHDWVASVEAAHDRLRAECDHVFVAGLSMGALLALHLAARRPREIKGVACYSTTLWHDGWGIPFTQFLLPLVLRMPGAHRFSSPERHPFGIKDERLRRRIVAQMNSGKSGDAGLSRMPFPSLLQMRRLTAAVKKEVPSITAPSLVVHAVHDDVSSIRNAEYLERKLGGPVTKCLLDDCYHMITLDKQRKQVLASSIDFFNGIVPAEQLRDLRPVA